jgi:hypothetical protein
MIQNLKKKNEMVDIMATILEHTKAIIRGEAPPPPVAKLIGFDVVSVEPGEAIVEFQATEVHRNPMGTLHGGILCDIADAAMGIAYAYVRKLKKYRPQPNPEENLCLAYRFWGEKASGWL